VGVSLDDFYDVIIVGGGPGGATAAKWVASYGIRTLLIERNNDFAVKACAEGVTELGLEAMGVSPSEKIQAFKINGAWLYPPELSESMYIPIERIGLAGYIVDKRLLLRQIVSDAIKAGAEVLMNANVIDILNDGRKFSGVVVSHDGEYIKIYGKVILLCDGVTGISKMFINRSSRTLEPALQYTMSNVLLDNDHDIYIFFGRKYAPLGYLWIFPKGNNIANVGLGARGVDLRVLLNRFIAQNPNMFRNSKVIKVNAGVIDLSGLVEDPVRDGLIVCGEAAGHVVPITGEGIGPSAVAGRIASEIIKEAFESNDFSKKFLSKYVERFRSHRYGKMIEIGLKARIFFERLDDKDLNDVFKTFDSQDFINIFNGNKIGYLHAVMKLLKIPNIMLKATGL
jgi:digeranylgeranylglycerophospholipid reductase